MNGLRMTAAVCCGLLLAMSAQTQAEDWIQRNIEVTGGGTLNVEFPASWGKKPSIDEIDGVTTVRFGPYGPRKKPFFMVHIDSVTALEPVSNEAIAKLTEVEVSNYKKFAAEVDIPINDLQGASVSGHYFSITDRQSKMGEFDYLTLAILASDHLLIKCYFFSSDGAPDFGADAMQLMRSISYEAPPPEPEKKK